MGRPAGRGWVGVGLLALAPHACFDVADLEDPGDGGGDASSDVGIPVPVGIKILDATLPPRPSGAAEPSGKGVTRWFAARRIYSGTIDPETGQADVEAWRKLGHDLDGECTTEEQSKSDTSLTCTKPPEAQAETLIDGEDCRDNAYGRILASAVQTLNSTWEAELHASIANGQPTLLLRISDLDSGPNDSFAPGAVYLTAPRKTAPAWDGKDVFQVQSSGVEGTSITDPPRMSFPDGYLAGNVWVSGDVGSSAGVLPIFLVTEVFETNLLSRVITVELDADHVNALGSAGSAIASRKTILDDIAPFTLGIVNCDQSAVDYLQQYWLLPSFDLSALPPSFAATGEPCEALSVGGAFQWIPVAAATELVDVPPPVSPCDGGSLVDSGAGDATTDGGAAADGGSGD